MDLDKEVAAIETMVKAIQPFRILERLRMLRYVNSWALAEDTRVGETEPTTTDAKAEPVAEVK